MTSVGSLRCEYKENPVGIDVPNPRLSWQLVSDRRCVVQAAHQIQVAETAAALQAGEGLLWDSGRVDSSESIHRAYAGPALQPGQRYAWRVRIWDGADGATAWSDIAHWEMGLLRPSSWMAQWIEPEGEVNPEAYKPCPYLRTTFQVTGEIGRARVYITSHGLYELFLNGKPVGDEVFTPGWTSYHERLQYQTYDVTDLLREGENAVGVVLGDGWYRGQVAAYSVRNVYGTKLALLFQMQIRYADGTEQFVISNESWKTTTGPLLRSDLKDGEVYDARLEIPGWATAEFDGGAWKPVHVVLHNRDHLVAPLGPPIRRVEEIRPIAVLRTPAGETVVDMGQNFAGRVRFRVQGPAGTTVTLRHGETLDRDGSFSMEHLKLLGKELLQQVQYTLKGGGPEVFEPHFTFHGFRYVKVEGWPGEPSVDDFTGIAIYSDMAVTGHFECSDPRINQLQHNIEWSQKSNFLDVPTDCPQRERAGWTGDAQIFARTGSFIMDTTAFFTKWLKDLAADQRIDGLVPNLVPDPMQYTTNRFARAVEGSSGWGDAAVIVPWTMYLCYADRRILEEQYESMKAWVGYMDEQARNVHWTTKLDPAYHLDRAKRERQRYIWDTKYHWGEWLEAGTKPAQIAIGLLGNLLLSQPLVATAYYAHSTGLLAKTARVLGKDEDAARFSALAEEIKKAYIAEFIGKDAAIAPHKQASYVRALAFGLLPEALRPAAVRRLVELIRENDNHLGTGFLSTPFLCHVLSENGYLDVAYDLLNQDSCPSWLYPVTKGATTIWESWDGIREDGSVFGSLNHYSYGAIGGWLYQVVAGIELDPQAPGYKRIVIQPHPGGGLSHARATYRSMYGEIESAWHVAEGELRLRVTIPPNTSAVVHLPGARLEQVTEGGLALSASGGIENPRQEPQAVAVDVGSGSYEFAYPLAG